MVQPAEQPAAWVRVDELTRAMARDFMRLEGGQRLPTVRDLAGRYGASLGSIQAALARLEGEGAIRVVRRARMGAHLADVSLAGLWSVAEGTPLILALPLPSNLRGQGLATGIKSALEERGLDTFLTFVRGSRNRIRALRDGRCHIVVMSGLAATISSEPGLRIALLPEHTFAEERRVFLHRPDAGTAARGRRPLRVVIDSESADLQYIAELEFAEQDVEFVRAVYMQSIALIESGSADAAVWDLDETTRRLPPHVVSRPLSDRVRAVVGDSDTRAAIVTRASDQPANLIVERCLRAEHIVEVQEGVLNGRVVPGY
jgi:hypothetical protein